VKGFFAFLMVWIALIPSAASAAERKPRWRTVWHVSQALLVAGNTADVATSWGKNEANPLLHTGAQFSYSSMAIKLGMMTGGLVAQHYIARKSPDQIPYFASANLVVAGLLGAVALHNTTVPPASH
jgi:hypothetical protein